MADRPNILFLFTDQQRYDTIAAAGYPHMITPNLDRLVRDGVQFRQCYTPYPVCVPARASIMTGRYCRSHGVYDNATPIPDYDRAWPARLSRAGYDTRAIGKMHFPPRPFNHQAGFTQRVIADDKCFTDLDDDYARWLRTHGLQRPNPWAPTRIDALREGYGAIPTEHAEAYHIDTYIGMEGVKAIEQAGDRPFCYWISFNSPHLPFDPPERFLAMYDGRELPPPIRRAGELDSKPPEIRQLLDQCVQIRVCPDGGSAVLTDEAMRRRRQYYYATVTLVDEWIGHILDALARRGLADNTVIIFSSDHGEANGDHFLLEKLFFYETIARVPLLLVWPGHVSPGAYDGLVSLVDLYPTLLSLAGVEADQPVDGLNLLKLLQGTIPARRHVFSEADWYGNRAVMVRTRTHKCVLTQQPASCELYDLQQDPSEFDNVFHDARYAPVRDELVRIIAGFSRGE